MLLILIIALPVSFIIHVAEEFAFPGGFIKWYHQYRPKFAGVKPMHYFKVNAIGFLLILATAILTAKAGKGYIGFLVVSGFLSCNAIFTHIVGAVKTRRYSPGMISGAIVFIPLTVLSYIAIYMAGKLDFFTIAECIVLSPLLELIFLKKPAPSISEKS